MRSSAALMRSLARLSVPRAIQASPPKSISASKRLFHPPRTSIRPRPSHVLSRLQSLRAQVRHKSSSSNAAASAGASTTAPESRLDRDQVPQYEMTFTCKKCSTRSSHRISKQGYHQGTVLITCPGCKNRHLISDHLKIFSDKPVTLEDIMREKGHIVKRGTLDTEGDIEFWDDGTSTSRSAQFHPVVRDADGCEGKLTESPTTKNTSKDASNAPTPKA